MRKTSVKPHILSWLQRAPVAQGKLIELSPALASTSEKRAKHAKRHGESFVITRSCLGSTTASSLLGVHRKPRFAWGSKMRLPLQVAAALALVFVLAPRKTPNFKIAAQPKPSVNSVSKTLSAFSDVTVRN